MATPEYAARTPEISSTAGRSRRAGWIDWVTTTDHKKIGILYLFTTAFFFLVGGVEALLMRIQLGIARQHVPRPDHLQPALHAARHDDDLHGRRADRRRLRELPRAAHDRRPRHGVPAPQHAVVVAARRSAAWCSTRVIFFDAADGRLDVATRRCRSSTFLPRARDRRVDPRRCTWSGSPRSSARSTSSPRSTTCARRA